MIFGLELAELPDGYIPLSAVAMIKCLDDEGEETLMLRATDGLRVWDCVGMLTVGLDTERDHAKAGYVSDNDDDDEEDA